MLPAPPRVGTVFVLPQQKRRLRTLNPIGQRHHEIGQPRCRAIGALAHEASVEPVHRRRADVTRHTGFSDRITEVAAGAADELSRSGRDVVVTAGGGHLVSGSLMKTSDGGKAISNRTSSATIPSTMLITSDVLAATCTPGRPATCLAHWVALTTASVRMTGRPCPTAARANTRVPLCSSDSTMIDAVPRPDIVALRIGKLVRDGAASGQNCEINTPASATR